MQQTHGWKQRFAIATIASSLCVGVVALSAWGQEGPAKAPAKEVQKTFAFEFRDTPWDKVLDWLADNSGGIPVVGGLKPQGTFNFVSPPGKKYTLPQIVDILNRSLTKDKILIIRNSTSYTVVQSDQAADIDTTILPNITIDDLEITKPYDQQKYGQSELCQLTFNLNNLTVDEAETNLNSRKGPFGRFQKIPKGSMLLATDTVGNLRQMKMLLDKIDPTGDTTNIEVFTLKPTYNGASAETSVKGLFNLNPGGPPPVPNAPKIQYDDAQNKIVVNGDKAQIKAIRDLLIKLNAIKSVTATPVEPGPGKQSSTTQGFGPVEDSIRVIPLKDVKNASQFVENLKYLLSSIRSNLVYVTYEPLMAQSLEDARKGIKFKGKAPSVENKNDNDLDFGNQAPAVIDNKPGRADRPVFIATLSRTSGLMIGSDDPEALDQAEQLLTYLIKEGDDIYEVIPLKNSNAKIVRDTLDELLNGKKQQNPMQMMMGPFGGGGGDRSTPLGPVIRLAADARTNSILVRAPRQIVVTIRRFIETELDVNNIDQKLQPKPRIIQLKHAFATDVVDVLNAIYREYLEQRGGGQQPGMPFNPFMQQQQPQQPERSIRLSIAASKADNSVIMNCPDVLWPEVEKLVEHLDNNNADDERSIRVINVGKADPQMLQKALETITGKQTGGAGQNQQNDPLAAMRNAMMNRFGGGGAFGGGNFGGGGNMGGGPRGGGGGNRGGGGGGNRGGGGGGPGGRGGRNRADEPPVLFSSTSKPGGSDFFADRVKEDPRTQVTFDNDSNNNNILPVQAQTPAGGQTPVQKPQDKPGTTKPSQVPGVVELPQPQDTKPRAPRGDVTFNVLPDGQVILIGPPEDVKLVEQILNELVKTSPSAETELRMFGLDQLDASSATNQLSKIFAKYNPVVRAISSAGAAPGGPGAGGARPGGGFGPGGGLGQGGFGQGGFGQGGLGQGMGQGAAVQPAQPGNMLLLTISRQNAILIGAPKAAMPEIERVIKMIDKPIDPESAPKIINLRKANAASLAAILLQFYQQRYPDESLLQTEIRIQADTRLNALVIHAGPADLKEIMSLVEFFDKNETKVINEVRIKALKNASAAELAALLQQALSQALLQGNTGTGTGTGLGGNQGAFGGFNQPNIFGGNQGGIGGQNALGANRPGQTGTDRKGVSLMFLQPGHGKIETGLLDDVGIYADTRTNRIVISAPPDSIAMLEKLIDELDIPPTIMADVKVFRLKRADAQSAVTTLQGVFLGQQRAGAGGQAGFGGNAFGGLNQQQQQLLNFSGTAGQGPQPIQPRFAFDIRTNSVIVAAGRGDMILAEVLLNNLDSAEIRDRMFQVVRLKNNQAVNVAQNLNTFFSNEIRVLQLNDLTNFMQTDHEVTVIADTTNNSLIIGASQRYFPEVMRLIDQLDIELAQVAVQVLIAQVRLDNTDEFGVEVGLQSPVLFERSLFGNPPPVATNATNQAIGTNGYNWNNVSTTNSSNSSIAGSTIVGMRGLTNYGTGTNRNGIGGFVFSAASNSVNVLVRALRTQGRIEVLSRPQIVTRDNQQAIISVGQQVPIVTGSNLTANGIIQNTVEQQQVGIILKVLPQISPDGRIVMRVEPQISKVSDSTVDIGNGVLGTIIDQTIASTTIDATDGKTVIIGGLITKEDSKQQRGIPWLGDLPYVGALFRYRSQEKAKTELLIILTPHIIRNPQDAERVFSEESRKMSWSLDDVQAIHGALPGGSFLSQPCPDNSLPGNMINPFDQNYFAPNTTRPQPQVDERLNNPGGIQPNNQGTPRMPIPNPPGGLPQQQQPQPQSQTPGWLQPPGATPPMFQQQPQGQQYQGYNGQPAGPVNNTVTGMPPQGMMNSAQAQAYVQALQQQQQWAQQQQQQQASQFQPTQTQMNGNWKTSVVLAQPPGATPTIVQTQEMPIRQLQPAGAAPSGFAGGGQQP